MMCNLQDLKIETERLILRIPRIEDAVEVNKAMNEVWNELQAWMLWSFDGQNTLESTRYYIETLCAEQIEKGGLPLFGFDKKTQKFVISTGLTVKDDFNRDEYSTGYWVVKDFLGKGYATETTKAVLKHAFYMHEAQTIFIDYFEGNKKSKNIIEKCGFVFTHTNPKAHARCSDGTLLDEHCYKITKPDYKNHTP